MYRKSSGKSRSSGSSFRGPGMDRGLEILNGRQDGSIPWENNPPFYKAICTARPCNRITGKTCIIWSCYCSICLQIIPAAISKIAGNFNPDVFRALARVPALRPDVAVLDVRLPDGDGVSVCRELRSQMPELACLMLTSFADDEALFDAIMAGASGYVLKQIRGADLTGAVRAVRTSPRGPR